MTEPELTLPEPLVPTLRTGPRSVAARYHPVLSTTHVPWLLVGTLIGRLPAAMGPILVLLATTASGTAYTAAATLACLQAGAAALGQPLLSRQVDRHGAALVLAVSTAATTAAFGTLAVLPTGRPLAQALLIAATGLCAPPLQSCLRVTWARLVPQEAQGAALALDIATAELIYLAAPLLAATTVQVGGARAGYATAAALGLIGTALVLGRHPAGLASGRPTQGRWLGALLTPGMPWLLPAHLAIGAAIGTVPIAALAVAQGNGVSRTVGVTVALFTGGAFIGGLLHGGARRRTPAVQLLRTTTGFTLLWLPLALLTAHPLAAQAAAFLPGLLLTPVLAAGQLTLQTFTPACSLTEASAWLICALGAGESLGLVLGGQHPDATWPAVAALSALLVIAAGPRLSGPAPQAPGHNGSTPPISITAPMTANGKS